MINKDLKMDLIWDPFKRLDPHQHRYSVIIVYDHF